MTNKDTLTKFNELYSPTKFNHSYETIDVQTGYGSHSYVPRLSVVDISFDMSRFTRLIEDAIAGNELRQEQDIRQKHSAIKVAYEHYITLLNLAK
jgi:hypothetical protein